LLLTWAATAMGSNGNAQSVPIGVAYGEIFVVYHGETEWNADGGIQVSFAFGFVFTLLIL